MAPVFSSPSFALCNNAVLNLMISYASLIIKSYSPYTLSSIRSNFHAQPGIKSYNSYEHDRIIYLKPYYVNRNYKISNAQGEKISPDGSLPFHYWASVLSLLASTCCYWLALAATSWNLSLQACFFYTGQHIPQKDTILYLFEVFYAI